MITTKNFMENKTAIDWLIEQVKSPEWQNMFIWHKEEVFQQAIKMDKEQRIQDMAKMQIVKDVDCDDNVEFIFIPEDYYYNTYKIKNDE